jgi:uncharacterized delta-60 repeat protein
MPFLHRFSAQGRSLQGWFLPARGQRSVLPSRPLLEPLEDRCLLTGGIVTLNLTNDLDQANAAFVDENDRIVIAGGSDRSDLRFLVARFEANGLLDDSFGDNGVVTTNVTRRDDDGALVALPAPDGKIVAAGWVREKAKGQSSHPGGDFAVVRYESDGSLDNSFGNGNTSGVATLDLEGLDFATAGLVLPDGSVIVGAPGFVLTKFTPTGEQDTTFGNNGAAQLFPFFGEDGIEALAFQGNKIIAVGTAHLNGYQAVFVARTDLNGQLDPSFGNNGVVLTQFGLPNGSGTERSLGEAVAIDANNNIVVVGHASANWPTTGYNAFLIARYLPDGAVDPSFGNGASQGMPGRALFTQLAATESSNYAQAVVIQPDGKIVAGGDHVNSNLGFALVRLNPDGSVDTSFGNDGGVRTPILSYADVRSLALQSDNKIVASGAARDEGFQPEVVALARYNPDGYLDTTFGEATPPPSGITVSPTSGLQTSESGATASFTVVLDTTPSADVTIPLSSSDPGEGTVSPTSLTFTPSNWNLPQTVTITGVDDALIDGDVAYTIATATAISTDPAYNGLDADDVSVTNTDDDAPSSSNGIYVWDIVFESRDRGNKHDERIAVVIREDSDGDGIAESSDAVVSGANVTVVLTGPVPGIFSGSTDSNGVFRTNWVRDVSDGIYTAEVTSLTHSTLSWDQDLDPTGNDTDIDGDNLPDQQHSNPEAHNLLAPSLGNNPDAAPLTLSQVEPLLEEALSRLSESGYSVVGLAEVQVVITDLPGTTLGQTVGQTIYLDINAANWGWFVDATPGDDVEFSTPGDQGEQGHIDLVTTLMHELGHLLGHDHTEEGLMQETLAAGVRLNPTLESEAQAVDAWLAEPGAAEMLASDWVFALLGRGSRAGKP